MVHNEMVVVDLSHKSHKNKTKLAKKQQKKANDVEKCQ